MRKPHPEEVVTAGAAVVVAGGSLASILLAYVSDSRPAAQTASMWVSISVAWTLLGVMTLMGAAFRRWRRQMAEWQRRLEEMENNRFRQAIILNRLTVEQQNELRGR